MLPDSPEDNEYGDTRLADGHVTVPAVEYEVPIDTGGFEVGRAAPRSRPLRRRALPSPPRDTPEPS
ncbi:hypothetical protein AB0J38_07585 [Streptomyces sp. NPDC050095]|uniref:hypothetical protein n=1 Tax=unclassified Streptomyces TaxID=2593676 RepID=UPI003416F4B6